MPTENNTPVSEDLSLLGEVTDAAQQANIKSKKKPTTQPKPESENE